MAMSPTQRSLKWCRDRSFNVDIVERWIPFGTGKGGIKKDLFGCLDLVALDLLPGILGIQCTSAGNAANRIKKLLESEEMWYWLDAANRIEVHGWRKNAKGRWVVNRWAMSLDENNQVAAERIVDDA